MNTLVTWIICAGVALASLLCALVLIAAFATRESHRPVFVKNIPQVSWVAAPEPLEDYNAALAAARRFLESPFIGLDTAGAVLHCEEDARGWRITARSSDDEASLLSTLLLSSEGEVLLYDGSPALGRLTALSWLHTLAAPSPSLDRYAAAFAGACLPGRSIAGATPVDDLSARDGAHVVLTTLTGTDGTLLTDGLAMIVEPEMRVVMYEREAMNGGV